MERESAVREILKSIGPLFPEDAQRARALRRPGQQDAPASLVTQAPVDQPQQVKLTTAPKPVLASQVDAPNIQKTQVADLAAVLDRLTPAAPAPSVRDAVPELVRAAPSINALRAALSLREEAVAAPAPVVESAPVAEPAPAPVVEASAVAEPEAVVEPKPVVVPEVAAKPEPVVVAEPTPVPEPAPVVAQVVETPSAFTELPEEPIGSEPAAALVEPEDVVFLEPSAEEIQAALAQAVEAQRGPEAKAPVVPAPKAAAPVEFSEDEHDAFVSAIADAILPARPYPAPAGFTAPAAAAPAVQPQPVVEPVVVERPVGAAPSPVVAPKPRFKRAKPKQAAVEKKPEIVKAPAPVAKAPEPKAKTPERQKAAEPQKAPEAEKAAAPKPLAQPEIKVSFEDDELIRQIRVHRDDMVDVDDQIARVDQEIAAAQQTMAQYVAAVEQKNAHRSRLVRLRTNTERFINALQVRAEPVKRQPKAKKTA